MYLWRKRVTTKWLGEHELELQLKAGEQLATIHLPGKSRVIAEVTCKALREARDLVKQFGGRIETLPRDWLKRFQSQQETKAIKVGKRKLIIPAGAAFGTGGHATTAMSLHMLERILTGRDGSPRRPRNARAASAKHPCRMVVDLGTGSGILALVARSLGAKRVIGFDNDPVAIRVAKQNARLNRIHGVEFRIGDVKKVTLPSKIDIVTANLFSELLIEVMPRFKRVRELILSGIMRSQENVVLRALRRHRVRVVETRRRGKWIAIRGTPMPN